MKIVFELQPIIKTKTGIGWYTYELIKAVSRIKEDSIELYGRAFDFVSALDAEKKIAELNIDIPIEICKMFPYEIYSRVWNYMPIPYDHFYKKAGDIYHFFNFLVPPKINGKVIVTIHDVAFKRYPKTVKKSNLRRLEQNIMNSIARADRIVTISESSKLEINQYFGVPLKNMDIISPGINLLSYRQEFDARAYNMIRKKYSLPREYILYLGTIEPRKNVETIIDSYELYRKKSKTDIKLVIAGGKGWMCESVFDRIRKYKLENDVIITGYVFEEDKPLIYQMSKLFVFPSLYEGFGIPPLEAMATGIPVITSNNSSLPEVVGDAAVLVEPKDVDQIAKNIDIILGDEQYRESLVKRGIERSERFTWDHSAQKLIELYKKLGDV